RFSRDWSSDVCSSDLLECLPPSSHPMDVMRTAVSVLGCLLPEKDDHNTPGARDIADRLMACLGSALLYWYHYSHNGRVIDVQTEIGSASWRARGAVAE